MKAALKKVVPYRAYAPIQSAFRRMRSIRYRGDRFRCPFCDRRFSAFLPCGFDYPILRELEVVGGGYRLNSVCPRCSSEDRERLIFLYLQTKEARIFSDPISLLHVAPEPNLSKALRGHANIRYLSADLDSPLAEVRMDITDIQEKSETFDVIICNHVLEHIPDDGAAMRELFRVLKTGGFAILQVPLSRKLEQTVEDFSVTDPSERVRRFGQSDHVRIYGRDYAHRLERAGFAVTPEDPYDFLSDAGVKEHGLLEDELLFVCRKN